MQARNITVKWKLLCIASLLGCLSPLFASRVKLEDGALTLGQERFVIHGVNYSIAAGAPLACLYARDLPLIAAMGANTVRTNALLPETDPTFLSLLETTGLYWLAGFPLDSFYDPSQTVVAKKGEILEAFRKYAGRFRAQPRVIAYVFGEEVTRDYNSKFAGSPSEFDALLREAAAVLAELDPEEPPLLATAVSTLDELPHESAGLSFVVWDASPGRSFAELLEEAREKTSQPILIGVDGAVTGDEQTDAEIAVNLISEIPPASYPLGAIGARFTGLFDSIPSGRPGLDSLSPRLLYRALTSFWNGSVPSSWSLEAPPRLDRIENAASGAVFASPGALIRAAGEALSDSTYSASASWPPAAATACLCINGTPAPLGLISPETLTAQVPWNVPPGEQEAVFFRAGSASSSLPVQIEKFAPGIFPGAVMRAGTACQVSVENGVRPGELLEVYGTGLGREVSEEPLLDALLNNTPAEVLYSGLLPQFVGLNQVNLRVDPATPPSAYASLELRMAGISSQPYPLSVVGSGDRPGITLASSSSEIMVQAGGEGQTIEIQAGGVNGYCGPVLFQAEGMPAGVSFRAPVAFTGRPVPFEVQARAGAGRIEGASFMLFGYAPGASSGNLNLRLTVLPDRGDIAVRVISGGYRSAPLARFEWNGRTLFSTTGGGPGRGLNLLPVNPDTGVFGAVQSFDTWGDPHASARLARYLAELPSGTIALFAAADDASLLLSIDAREAIAVMFGSSYIRNLGYQESWAMIARKDGTVPIAENASLDSQVILDQVLQFQPR